MQHMHGNITFMFDCLANLDVHLLELIKTSMLSIRHLQLQTRFNILPTN